MSGSVLRKIHTAAETMMNANRVPMLTRSASKPRGASAAAAATPTPTTIVDFQGVLNRGCTAAKTLWGKRPSRDIASRIRG